MESKSAKYIFITGGVVSSLGKGITAASLGHAAQGARPQGRRAEARSVHERRPGHHVAVPARRGLRDRGRRRDRPRPRPLRALHRREHLARLELDRGQRLQHRHPPRAQGRVPRLDRPGDPAHHRRDQEPHPARLVLERRRHRARRDRRHGRRHREPAVPRGDPPAAHAARPRQRALPARHARADDRGRRRAQDQAHAALRQRAAPHRYLARRRRRALVQPAAARAARQDRPLRRPRRARRDRRRGRAAPLHGAAPPARAAPRRARAASTSASRSRRASSRSGRRSASRIDELEGSVRIAIVGKYVQLQDAYLSVVEALKHGAIHHGTHLEIEWVDAETLDPDEAAEQLRGVDGILIPGGFGPRAIEGKVAAVRYARESGTPFLGICLGMQCAVVEFARNVCDMRGRQLDRVRSRHALSRSSRCCPSSRTSRTWAARCAWAPSPSSCAAGTRAHDAYGETLVYERHRHRYEVNNHLRPRLEAAGLQRLGRVRGQGPRRGDRARRPPVVLRLAVPPRVQVAPDAAASRSSATSSARRSACRRGGRAHGMSAAVEARRRPRPVPRAGGDPEPLAAASAPSRTAASRTCATSASIRTRTRRRSRAIRRATSSAASRRRRARPARRSCSARTSTRSSRRRRSSPWWPTASSRTRATPSSAATTRRPWPRCSRACAASSPRTGRTPASS